MFWEIITVLFVLCGITQGVYIIIFLWFAPRKLTNTILQPSPNEHKVLPAVSIVICARNELQRLKKNLSSVLLQNYLGVEGNKLFEVIVVNDNSTDGTAEYLDGLKQVYSHLRVLHINDGKPGKKQAQYSGALMAKHDYLLFTDADCYAITQEWISSMVKCFGDSNLLVAGYGGYENKGTFLDGFIGFETLQSFTLYASFARMGLPYMAVGRNLAVQKDAYLRAAKDKDFNKLPYGDDDLLVRAIADKNNIAICYNRDAITISQTPNNWAAWLHQKQRHVSTAKYYKWQVQLALGVYAVSQALLWILFIYMTLCRAGSITFIIITLYALLKSYVMSLYAVNLGVKKQQYIFFDFGWMIYNFALSPFIFFFNKKQWR